MTAIMQFDYNSDELKDVIAILMQGSSVLKCENHDGYCSREKCSNYKLCCDVIEMERVIASLKGDKPVMLILTDDVRDANSVDYKTNTHLNILLK